MKVYVDKLPEDCLGCVCFDNASDGFGWVWNNTTN